METQVQNESSSMSYGHMSLDRRDSNLDNNVSTPFQSHQSIGQALGNHLPPVNSRPYQDAYRIPSPSPTPIHNGGPPQSHSVQTNTHSPLNYAVQQPPGATSPSMKRKPMEGVMPGHLLKRRRDEEGDSFDSDGGAQGAKHWTDEEKTKLFTWLMGPGQDDHWNALRATKNSCLRECAVDVFGSKKTYQALKGCYERNFNLFKQIYAFEAFHARSGPITTQSEAERLREYERRLQAARKGGCDVGNISPRNIEHWMRAGWYNLFYARWHGDPATTRPAAARHSGVGASTANTAEDQDVDEDVGLDYTDPPSSSFSHGMNGGMNSNMNGLGGMTPNSANNVNNNNVNHLPEPSQNTAYLTPNNTQRESVQPFPDSPTVTASASTSTAAAPTLPLTQHAGPEPALINFTLTQSMMNTYMQYLHTQTQTSKLKLDLMRKREEREASESTQRSELERLRLERERAKWEHDKQSANVKQKADRAVELLSNPSIDASTKQAASDFLKRMFATD